MSADNWTRCPQCARDVDATIQARDMAADEAYGKVAPDEYLRLVRDAQEPIAVDDTFREDYEIGLRGDQLEISYSGRCKKCGLQARYKFSRSVFELE